MPRVAMAVAFVALVACFGIAPAATAQTSGLGGYSGSAAASGLHALYNPVNVLPIPPPVDIGAPDALATIASGPATFARAGVADPGDLLANPDALLALFSSSYKAGTLPPYPYRISATSSTGSPDAESNPAPGLNARVHADGAGSRAQAAMPAAITPAVATFGSSTSIATTSIDGDTITVHSRAEFTNLDVLGVLTFQSLVTDLTGKSVGGGKPTFAGLTTISGAKLAGTPVTIDDKGVHDGAKNLNSALAAAGIKVTLVGPLEQAGSSSGQLLADGLRIDLEFSKGTQPALHSLLDAIPSLGAPIPGAPSPDDLVTLVKARHLSSIEIGRGAVTLATRGARGAITDSPLPDLSASPPDLSPAPDTGTVAGESLTSLSPAPPASVAGVIVPARPAGTAVPIGEGVAGLLALVLLVQPFIGHLIARRVDGLLAGSAAPCPWEET
ncbi:MAG TPA: hypothetical protein VFA83_06545 [Acidimicrobiales bacterium]|nr:hypothetical protein [Acidimicrobiales bacterium]